MNTTRQRYGSVHGRGRKGWRTFLKPGWVFMFLAIIAFSYAAFSFLAGAGGWQRWFFVAIAAVAIIVIDALDGGGAGGRAGKGEHTEGTDQQSHHTQHRQQNFFRDFTHVFHASSQKIFCAVVTPCANR